MPLDLNDPELLRVIGVSNSELGTLEEGAQKRLLRIYQEQRDLLVAKIGGLESEDTFGARQLQVAMVAVDEAIARLNEELYQVHLDVIRDSSGMSYEAGVREVSTLEGRFGSRASSKAIASLSGVVPHRALLAVEQLARYETEGLTISIDRKVKPILQQGLVQGLNSRQLVPALRKSIGDACDQETWQLERTLRTGLNAAVSRGHNAAYLDAREEVLEDLKRQGHEFIMTVAQTKAKGRVNHPFSAYLDGKVAELDQPWRVKSPAFKAMFWVRDGDSYVGMYYPAHLYERGRQVPYRDAWNVDRTHNAARAQRAVDAQKRTEQAIAEREDKKSIKKEPPPGPAETGQGAGESLTGPQVRERMAQVSTERKAQAEAITKQIAGLHPDLRAAEAAGDDAKWGELWNKHKGLQQERMRIEDGHTQAMREVLYHAQPAQLAADLSINRKAVKARWSEGVDAFARLVGPGPLDGKTVEIQRVPKGKPNRAFYSYNKRSVFMDTTDAPRTIVHELGHFYEHQVPGAREAAIGFWERRTKDDSFERLRDLYPNAGFDPKEWTKKDQFRHAYVGKVYYRSGGNKPIGPSDTIDATEVISMGIEEMYADPAGFATRDPDYFDFIWHLIRRQ